MPQPLRPLKDLITVPTPETQRASALYIGAAKLGKTSYLASWADRYPVLPEGGPDLTKEPIEKNAGSLVAIYWDPNSTTLQNFHRRGYNLEIMQPTITEYEQIVLPALEQGRIETDTIGFDSFYFYNRALLNTIDMSNKRWGMQIANKLTSQVVRLVEATTRSGRYNLICTVHEAPVTNQEGSVIGFSPAMTGQMKEAIARYFDIVLLCSTQQDTKMVESGGAQKMEKGEIRYVCHTVETGNRLNSAGGGLWGATFPPVVGGTYRELREAADAYLKAEQANSATN